MFLYLSFELRELVLKLEQRIITKPAKLAEGKEVTIKILDRSDSTVAGRVPID
jgi:hypothetical protein